MRTTLIPRLCALAQDCKDVIGLLSTLTKNSTDPSRQKIVNLLRRWKQVRARVVTLLVSMIILLYFSLYKTLKPFG